jgi:D-alanyl-D-alanine carboxypeptidase (penicillin-binding protein 5/6)
MRRSRLLHFIAFIYILAIGACGIAGFSAWISSSPVAQAAVLGESTDTSIISPPAPTLSPYPSKINNSYGLSTLAKEYAVYHVESGTFVLKSSTMEPVPFASTTKMMTLLLASKLGSYKDIITISDSAANQIPSRMDLYSGERIKKYNLFLGAALVSGNDAAYALAEDGGGILLNNPNATSAEKVLRFVQEMNREAAALHMDQTHYDDPAGLSDENGRSTAMDLAKLASVLIQQPVLKDILVMPEAHVTDVTGRIPYNLVMSNRLVTSRYAGILGVKTGYTPGAGHCLVAAAKRGNDTYVAVVLNVNVYQSNGIGANDMSAYVAGKFLDLAFSPVRRQ